MLQYAVQRIALAIPTVFGMTLLIFFMFRVLMPVDGVDLTTASAEVSDPVLEQQLRERYGLDGSLVEQYVRWLGNLLQGDSGKSFYTDRTVASEMAYRVPTSLQLGLGAILISVVVAVPLGLLSAIKQDSWIDYITRGTSVLFYALPGFWIATLVLVFASTWFQWSPPIQYKPFWEDPRSNMLHMMLPMLIMGLRPIGVLSRLVRTQVLEVVRQDYIRTARAKGLSPRKVYFGHALRNAMIPFVTVIGLEIPTVVAGTVIYEQIFLVPGVGQYLIQALQRLDLFVIMATNLFFALILVLANIVVDISYGFIDPRVRVSRGVE